MTFWDFCSPIYDFAQKRNENYDAWNNAVAAQVEAERTVLELAGGTGEISLRIAHKAERIVCTDLSARMLKVAKKKARGIENISFELADLYALHYADDSFDVVIASQVLHLLDRPEAAAAELQRVAKQKIILPLCLVKDVTGFARFQINLWKLLGFKPKQSFDEASYLAFLEGLGLTVSDAVLIEGSMPMIIAVCEVQ